mgnify:CR=1 FL=1
MEEDRVRLNIEFTIDYPNEFFAGTPEADFWPRFYDHIRAASGLIDAGGGGSSTVGKQSKTVSTYFAYDDLSSAMDELERVIVHTSFSIPIRVAHVTFHTDFTLTHHNMLKWDGREVVFATSELAEHNMMGPRS